jgi:hypothetical protein
LEADFAAFFRLKRGWEQKAYMGGLFFELASDLDLYLKMKSFSSFRNVVV